MEVNDWAMPGWGSHRLRVVLGARGRRPSDGLELLQAVGGVDVVDVALPDAADRSLHGAGDSIPPWSESLRIEAIRSPYATALPIETASSTSHQVSAAAIARWMAPGQR